MKLATKKNSVQTKQQIPPTKKIDNKRKQIEEEEEVEVEEFEDEEEDIDQDDIEEEDEDDIEEDDGVEEGDGEEGDEDNTEEMERVTGMKKQNKVSYVLKQMTTEKMVEVQKKNENKGIVYVSTIPAGMTANKLKQLLMKEGMVSRMHLVKADVERKHRRNNMFKEGWIEFNDKRRARHIATVLNNCPMGGKNRDKHRDCLWNLRYLPKFKWHHLMDRLVQKKLERDQRLLHDMAAMRKENAKFLEQVQYSKYAMPKLEKKVAKSGEDKVLRTFKQRKTHELQNSVHDD
ncbi:RNA-binding region RNP-1 domain-containing protein [Cavenderia fasciculata]|uniref:RNA-binding region RNP-1 domain-containing protein n=1 Tax=Cavenderia fasciculata TaxID=261658 RepID=F4Q4V7_CACFS|nr:RNA-binding region RNP-1 domain-containing protein [Cavenderia fasciculata]EGG17903.1 RNA-binding region RNP-1 domain-containing protein [Cavenderia fasciculata]|eukprot:XP_004356387.1 RNA-binding region RNP-1 domain-containing protein [Cavenderia fasciculata]